MKLRLHKCNRHPTKIHPCVGAETLLTVSLGEPYGRDGYCYKLAAAVIAL